MSSVDDISLIGIARNVEELKWLEEQLGMARECFLRQRGWTYSSSYPGSRWLWSKTINDKTYSGVGTKSAIAMEGWADFLACKCDEGDECASPSPECPVHGSKP